MKNFFNSFTKYMSFRRFNLAIISLLTAGIVQAQSLYPFLQTEIQGNNTELQAAAHSCESAKADNMSGLTLANPEVGVSYMLGVPSDVPDKTNIGVSQSFDFPTLSGARKRVAEAESRMADAGYMAVRSALAADIENALIDYTYAYLKVRELEACAAAPAPGTDKEAIMANLSVQDELDMARMELSSARALLTRLNGGKPLAGLPAEWPETTLPASLEEWTAQAATVNPALLTLRSELTRAQEEVCLRKQEGLPEFSVGYANELVKGANYHGATLCFSLPLWGNHGRVKAAKAQRASAEMTLQAAQDNFALSVRADYERAHTLHGIYERSRKALNEAASLLGTSDLASPELSELRLRTLKAAHEFYLARTALYAPVL